MLNWLKRNFRDSIYPIKDLLDLIPAESRILDVGCGQGQFLKSVALNRSPTELGGFEISEPLIQLARKELAFYSKAPVSLRLYDGTNIPAEVQRYDIVSFIDILHHIQKPRQEAFILALYKAMRPGAKLLVKDIDAARPMLCMANRLHDLLLGSGGGQERSREFVEQLLKATGFRIVSRGERRILWYPHFWVLVVKSE